MIKLQAIGNLGRDAELKTVNEKQVINFSLAHTEKINGVEKTIWIDCAKWGEKIGILPYLKKGQKVFVEGQPDLREYDKKDGSKGTSLTLRVAHIELCSQASQQTAASGADLINKPIDDLPW